MIVWLASYPRSGNTLFRLVLHQLYGYDTWSVYDEFGVDDRQVELVGGRTAGDLEDLQQRRELCVVKTHELPAADRWPALLLVRDGRDVLVSYARYICARGEARDPASVMRDLLVHEASFGGWGPHVEAWLARRPAPGVVRFEDLIGDPAGVVEGAMAALGHVLGPRRPGAGVPSFEDLSRRMPAFFQTGRPGGYLRHMPADLQDLFGQKYGATMARLGYGC